MMNRRSLFRTACFGLANALFATSLAFAAVTTTGQVDPSNPASWDFNTFAYVGQTANGSMTIAGGSSVISSFASLGGAGVLGEATVTGAGSTWEIQGFLTIADRGVGIFTIENGGLVVVGDNGFARNVLVGHFGGSGILNLNDGGTLQLQGGAILTRAGVGVVNFNGGRLEGFGSYEVGAGLTQNGGVLAPGYSPGITTVLGFYALNSGALELELLNSGTGGVVGFDQLAVRDGVTLGVDSQLDLVLRNAPNVGDSFLIVDNRSSSPISGAFANDDALTADFGSMRYNFSVDYTAGNGNDVRLSVIAATMVPEPSGVLLAALALIAGVGRLRGFGNSAF